MRRARCRICRYTVAPQPHCPPSNKKCDWWVCPICHACHCHGRVIKKKEKKE